MNIALTYDLKDDYLARGYSSEAAAEFDSRETIEALATVMAAQGHTIERIGNLQALLAALHAGIRPDLVFNLCEGEKGVGREALVPALLEAYDIPCVFSDSAVMALSLHKGLCKLAVRGLGVPTADFTVVESLKQLEEWSGKDKQRDFSQAGPLAFPLFAKPIAEGTSKGISRLSRIESLESLHQVCASLLAQYQQPVLLESFLPGREFTVGIVGTGEQAQVVGAMEIVYQDEAAGGIYSYESKFVENERLIRYEAAESSVRQVLDLQALKVWRGLGCRDGGRLDFRMDAQGVLHFLEINPLAGLNPDYGDLPILGRLHGWSHEALVKAILSSAINRIVGYADPLEYFSGVNT